jgi:hypothetical protein
MPRLSWSINSTRMSARSFEASRLSFSKWSIPLLRRGLLSGPRRHFVLSPWYHRLPRGCCARLVRPSRIPTTCAGLVAASLVLLSAQSCAASHIVLQQRGPALRSTLRWSPPGDSELAMHAPRPQRLIHALKAFSNRLRNRRPSLSGPCRRAGHETSEPLELWVSCFALTLGGLASSRAQIVSRGHAILRRSSVPCYGDHVTTMGKETTVMGIFRQR